MSNNHALVIGGTGMLSDLCLHLGRQYRIVSVVARGSEGLQSLKTRAGANNIKPNPIHVDYRDNTRLRALLDSAVHMYGPVSLCVSWIHSSAPQATRIVAETINTGPDICRYYDLLSSTAADPSKDPTRRNGKFTKLDFVSYHSIVLGFIVEDDNSRWLTHDEITEGIVRAIDCNARETVIGTVTPWERRPQK